MILDFQKIFRSHSGKFELNIQTEIKDFSFTTLYGKSGAGKTSILNVLAGLIAPDKGKIVLGNEVWYNSVNKINLHPRKRSVGMVFQDYALFPNMTVKENLQYALMKNQNKNVIDSLIEIVELGDLRDNKPNELSGGQKQRVALARALVQRPKLLLLDEPLSALDKGIRSKLQRFILEVHKEYNLTTILVSHDFPEISAVSEEIIVVESGKIIKTGTVDEMLQEFQNKIEISVEVNSVKVIDGNEFAYVVINGDKRKIKIPNARLGIKAGDRLNIIVDLDHLIVR